MISEKPLTNANSLSVTTIDGDIQNLNSTAPTLIDLTKIHKEGNQVRPIVNWRNAPAYKLAKIVRKKLGSYIPLPYTFNISYTVQLLNNLIDIPYDSSIKFASFDITNMYSNIPTKELLRIINTICEEQGMREQTKKEIIKLYQILVEQNYFIFHDTTYIQNEGLAMGAPTSSVFSEIYLQYIENKKLYDILIEHHIQGYFRYVDGILIVYNENKTNIHNVLDAFNNTVPNLKFTLEEEVNNKINFLDVTITKKDSNLSFDIYRKPSFTDTIIPNDSCHPREHKLSAIRYLVNRMTTYNLDPTSIQKEHERLKQILLNNKYDTSILHNVNNKNNEREHDTQKTKWAKFTYMGKEARLIANLFKNTDIKVAFTTNNNVERHLSTQCNQIQNKYDKCGIYQLNCPSCSRKYMGQTRRLFRIRFQEHFRDYKYMNNKSKFSQHLLDNEHSIGHMENKMDILHITNKGRMLDTLEKFYIYRETKRNNQNND
jgi:hypothetical protein